MKRHPKAIPTSQPMTTHMSVVTSTVSGPTVTTATSGMLISSPAITHPISLAAVSTSHIGPHIGSLASHQPQPLQLTTSHSRSEPSKPPQHSQPHTQATLAGHAKMLSERQMRTGAAPPHPLHMSGQIRQPQAAHSQPPHQQTPNIVGPPHRMSHPNKPLPSPLPQSHTEQHSRSGGRQEGAPQRPPSAHSQQNMQSHETLPPRPSSGHEHLIPHAANVQGQLRSQLLHGNSALSPHGQMPPAAHSQNWPPPLHVAKPEGKLEQLVRREIPGPNNPGSNILHMATCQPSKISHGNVVFSQPGSGLPRAPSPALVKVSISCHPTRK